MILTGPEIAKQVEMGRIHIHPFKPETVGPNSYDLRLGDTLLTYYDFAGDYDLRVLDPKRENRTHKSKISEKGTVLMPDVLYLANTVEEAGSEYYVPMLEGRSSLGRLGLKVHVTAGFGDLGFQRQWTLELEVTHPLRVYPGMSVCQIYFHTIEGEKKLYEGKYLQSVGAETSQSWRDFRKADD
jgi:dCTP deaminase